MGAPPGAEDQGAAPVVQAAQAVSLDEVRALLKYLTEAEAQELDELLAEDIEQAPWRPLPGPQRMAYESEADVVGFGGAAGGGKTDLALGLALTAHSKTQIVRREGPQLSGMLERLGELVDSNLITGNPRTYKGPDGRRIAFNSIPNSGDETKYQGIPKDLLVVDEAANCLESQVRFLKGWVRTTTPGQRTRTLLTFNPPTSAEGRWVVDFFAPWLDKRHALYPKPPGELVWVYTDPLTRQDVWLDEPDPRPFVLADDGARLYDIPEGTAPEDVVTPESRTFIPSRIGDNPFLVDTGYIQTLQALPEPLRSQMLHGDFAAGMSDDAFQVIPTAWVDAAMARWADKRPRPEMMQMGVDVARGGDDNTVLATRYAGNWYGPLVLEPGTETPNGHAAAALVLTHARDNVPVQIDVIGVGASPYDILSNNRNFPIYACDVRNKATARDKTGKLEFFNMRTQLWWQMREELDPDNDTGIALPPDKQLAKELCAPRFEMRGAKVYVEGREDLIKRLGYSPDRASALIMARIEMPKVQHISTTTQQQEVLDYNPYLSM